jgi:magnesium transporter
MNEKLLKSLRISRHLPRMGKIATIPGTINYVGIKREAPVKLHILDYNERDLTEEYVSTVEDCLPFKESPTVTWLDISGVHDENIINELGGKFNIHPLVLEDIANTAHRPKVEEYEDYLFVIVKMAYFNPETAQVNFEQVSLILGKDYVISLQEREGDVLEELRERIRNSKGKVRRLGSDYLMYCILDAIVDSYYKVLESLGGQMEEMELGLLKNADQELLARIYSLKHELVFLRKLIWPMREVISSLQKSDSELISEGTSIYLRDVNDHTVHVVETVETFRDMTSGMLDLYLTTVSNKMNEVMKVLTIFAAIFIPLTFLAGVYGMNFEFMPELKWGPSYLIWWIITLILAVGMIIFFKRKKWM